MPALSLCPHCRTDCFCLLICSHPLQFSNMSSVCLSKSSGCGSWHVSSAFKFATPVSQKHCTSLLKALFLKACTEKAFSGSVFCIKRALLGEKFKQQVAYACSTACVSRLCPALQNHV